MIIFDFGKINVKGVRKHDAFGLKLMDKQYSYCYDIRINTGDYTYVTTNGAFYDFRGERLLYSPFDSMLVGNSLSELQEHIRTNAYGKTFIMEVLARDGAPCTMICYLEEVDAEDQVRILMIEADKMSDRYLSLGAKQQEASALLSQFDSVYFTYDRF